MLTKTKSQYFMNAAYHRGMQKDCQLKTQN